MKKEYTINDSEYLNLGKEVLHKVGISEEHSAIIMESLLDCDKKGVYTHGFSRLPTYIMQLKRNNLNINPTISKIKDDSIVKLINADHSLGAISSYYAMNEAIKISDNYGVGVVGVRNSSHFGAAGYYTEMASSKNKIGIAFTNASPGIAPTGSTKPLLGNNPWSISVPTNFDHPITLDIANSVVARGKIRLANAKKESIPIGWAINKFGEDTNNPQEALDDGAILPIGDYKGYGITLMIELLTGVLTGSGFGTQNSGVSEDGKRLNGHLFISLDIEKFMELSEYKERVDELVNMIKSLPKIDEKKEILLPGELEWKNRLSTKEGEVKISQEIYNVMNDFAKEYSLPTPNFITTNNS